MTGTSIPTPRKSPALRIFAAIAALITATTTPACDDSGAESPEGLRARLYGASGADNPFTDIGWMRIYVRGEGMSAPLGRFVRYEVGGSASLEGIPFGELGEKRQLVVEGRADANGQPGYILSIGRSKWFEVRPTTETQVVDVLFTRANTVLALPTSTTGVGQFLQSGRMAAGIATTDREIVVSGGGTVDAAGSPWWDGAAYTRVVAAVEVIDLETNGVASRTNLLTPRVWHTATGLVYGQAIIAGGFSASGQRLDEVELYNPPSVGGGVPARLPKLAVPRACHTATLINENDRVMLFVGGDEAGTWELWDPVNGSHGAIALPDGKPRRHHRATVFDVAGRSEPGVLITGGESPTEIHQTVMLFDSAQQTILPFPEAMPGGARTQHGAVYVPDQKIIYVIGGFTRQDRGAATSRVDAFDTGLVRFRGDAAGLVLGTARGGLEATLLSDNRVLIAGGMGQEPAGTAMKPLRSLELVYDFVDAGTQLREVKVASSYTAGGPAQMPWLAAERIGHGVVALPSGHGVVLGGAGINPVGGGLLPRLEVVAYNPQ